MLAGVMVDICCVAHDLPLFASHGRRPFCWARADDHGALRVSTGSRASGSGGKLIGRQDVVRPP